MNPWPREGVDNSASSLCVSFTILYNFLTGASSFISSCGEKKKVWGVKISPPPPGGVIDKNIFFPHGGKGFFPPDRLNPKTWM